MQPLIGIVAKYLMRDSYYGWSWMRVGNSLRGALIKNGAAVFAVLPQTENLVFQAVDEHDDSVMTDEEKAKFTRFLDACDGVVLQGGLNSCYYEEFTARYCYEKNIPLLGICAGYNTIIRALGGTTKKLANDEHEKPDEKYVHGVKVVDETSLYYSIVNEKEFMVNSIHQYVGDVIPDSLTVVAKSSDDQVEVVEAKGKKFYMGIKYHPELLSDFDEKQNAVIKAFVDACKK